MHARVVLPLTVLLCVAVGCGRESLQRADQSFRVEPASVEFEKTLEGRPARATVTIINTARSSVPLTFEVEGAFSLEGGTAETVLRGGSALTLALTFTAATEGRATGVLTVSGGTQRHAVPLDARAVRPLACEPSASCRESRFDLQTEGCIESIAADGSACVPSDVCLENGVCLEGTCLGTPRDCDDGNLCTQDGCAAGVGCVNTPRVCPPPSKPCHLSVCSPSTGCGEVNAPDYTVCGQVDPSCDFADLCLQGDCERVTPAPDGLTCAPATPCRPEGVCQSAACEQEPPSPMVPAFSEPLPSPARLDADGRTKLVDTSGGVAFELCGLEASLPDGSTESRCGLASYTGSGFQRFLRAYDDAAPRALVASQGGRILVAAGSALESYGLSTGARGWRAELAETPRPAGAEDAGVVLSPSRVAVSSGDEAWVALGYASEEEGTLPVQSLVRVGLDGGTVLAGEVSTLGPGGSVALSEDERSLWLATPSGGYGRVGLGSDGGVEVEDMLGPDAGVATLSAAGSSVLVGEATQVRVPTGGGVPVVAGALAYAAGERPDGKGALLSGSFGHRFVRACPGGTSGCATSDEALYVERFPLAQLGEWPDANQVLSRAELAAFESGATLETATLLPSGDVCAVTQTSNGGLASRLTAHRGTAPLFSCELAQGRHIRGARFGSGRLFLIVEQSDGSYVLEGYRLGSVSLEQKGWPVFDGAGATKRPSP